MASNGNMAHAVALPQSIEEVEQLVKRLYQPGPPHLIASINDQLQQLQRSEYGWKLADELMGSEDQSVRFFAALTFTVKLNNEGSVHDPELSLLGESPPLICSLGLHSMLRQRRPF